MERDRDKLAKILKVSRLLARPRGFEPLTLGLENRCSIQNPLKMNFRHKIIQQNSKNFDRIVSYERQGIYSNIIS